MEVVGEQVNLYELNAKIAARDCVLYAIIQTILGKPTADEMKATLTDADAEIEAAFR